MSIAFPPPSSGGHAVVTIVAFSIISVTFNSPSIYVFPFIFSLTSDGTTLVPIPTLPK